MKWDSGYIYENTNFPAEPKVNFKVVLDKIKGQTGAKNLLDLGCASGEFVHYVNKFLPSLHCTGLDFNPDLIQRTKNNPKASFRVGDILNLELGQKFDIVTMIGVLTCFDDFKPIVDKMMAHTNKGGSIFVVSIFNDDDIDVRLKFRNNTISSDWQVGYNLFPISSVVDYAEQKGGKVTVSEIELPFDLAKQDDSLRSWTVRTDGGRYSLNGLMLLYRLKCVEIMV